MLKVTLLGQFDVQLDGRPLSITARPAQRLLAYLALHRGRLLPRDKVAGVLWPDSLDQTALKNLRNYVWQLRKQIDSRFLTADKTTITLTGGAEVELDVETLQAESRSADTTTLRSAVDAYHGEFLPGIYDDWAQLERERLQSIFERRMADLLDQLKAEEQWSDLAQCAEHWISFGHVPEPAYRALILAHAQMGDLAGAATSYRRGKKALEDGLGVPPSQETESLFRQIEAGTFQADQANRSTPSLDEFSAAMPELRLDESRPVFVGRQVELAKLGDALASSTGGQGQMQFVVGGAGRGKTALVAEFARSALESNPELLVANCYCHGHSGVSDPYAPFRQALAQLTGDVSSQAGATPILTEQARRLWSAMPLTVPALIEQAPDLIETLLSGEALKQRAATFARPASDWFKSLSDRLQTPFRDNLRQSRLFSQFTALLQSVSQERPLLLIIEDLHWVDEASTSLLFHLSRQFSGTSIMILGTYRPEEVVLGWDAMQHPFARAVNELKRQHGDIWLDLGEVAEAEGRAFVEAYIDTEPNQLDQGFRAALYKHTGGHALFTVELLKAMKERGNLVLAEDGCWQPCDDFDWNELPARIEGVIEQRFSFLPADMRSAMTVASVEGETFTAEVVARVQHLEDRDFVRRLSEDVDRQRRLIRAQSLARVGQKRLSQYRFRHQLFQQFLYQRLDDSQRAYLHEDVGQAMYDLYGSEDRFVAPQLAWHFEKAGLTAMAVHYLTEAARQAALMGANNDVLEHCDHALSLLSTLPQSEETVRLELSVQMTLGHNLMATKGYADADTGAAFTRARELCRLAGDPPLLYPVLRGIWAFYLARAEYQLAHELAVAQLQLAQGDPYSSPHLNASWMMGMTLFYLGDLAEASEHLGRMADHYDRDQHSNLTLPNGVDLRVSSLSTNALALYLLGFPDQAAKSSSEALARARHLAHPLSLAYALVNEGWLALAFPERPQSQTTVEECLAVTTEYGFLIYQIVAMAQQFYMQGLVDDAEAALAGMARCLTVWRATGAQFLTTDFLAKAAEISLVAGDSEAGLALIEEGIEFSRRRGERFVEPQLHRLKGALLLQKGETAAAEDAWNQALEIALGQEARLTELRVTLDLCDIWQKQGKTDQARKRLLELYLWFDEGFDQPELIEARKQLQKLGALPGAPSSKNGQGTASLSASD